MKQINDGKIYISLKIKKKKKSPEQSALKGFPTNTMTKNSIFNNLN